MPVSDIVQVISRHIPAKQPPPMYTSNKWCQLLQVEEFVKVVDLGAVAVPIQSGPEKRGSRCVSGENFPGKISQSLLLTYYSETFPQ